MDTTSAAHYPFACDTCDSPNVSTRGQIQPHVLKERSSSLYAEKTLPGTQATFLLLDNFFFCDAQQQACAMPGKSLGLQMPEWNARRLNKRLRLKQAPLPTQIIPPLVLHWPWARLLLTD